MNNNILDLIGMLQGSSNPNALLTNLLQSRLPKNPVAENLIDMLNSNNSKGIENLARNLCKEKGVNPEEIINTINNKMYRR